jgi:hypothetical protein
VGLRSRRSLGEDTDGITLSEVVSPADLVELHFNMSMVVKYSDQFKAELTLKFGYDEGMV